MGHRFTVSDLNPEPESPATALHQYQFRVQPHSSGSARGQNRALYRFGPESPLMSNSWPPSSSASSAVANPNVDLASMQHTMSFNAYEDAAVELTVLPASSASSAVANPNIDLASMQHTMSFNEYEDAAVELPALSAHSGRSTPSEKTIRRRSSKGMSLKQPLSGDTLISVACDQCRKSKCKCERSADGESCKNCVMMNTRSSPLYHRRLNRLIPIPSMYISWPLSQARPPQRVHRRYRGTFTSD
jgi:hypothetical protein